ncbi:hypothetical protein PENSPDRAFT_262926 [Peniophora sp. CONT]|nr:hypothetical protein PENSPDRAFT_262926 [Peniophora sp. CONT]
MLMNALGTVALCCTLHCEVMLLRLPHCTHRPHFLALYNRACSLLVRLGLGLSLNSPLWSLVALCTAEMVTICYVTRILRGRVPQVLCGNQRWQRSSA